MEKSKKILRNLLLFVFLIWLTFFIILKDQDVSEIFKVLLNINKWYILIAIICMFLYLLCETINLGRTLKALNEESKFWKNFKYVLIGFFFSSITPAATGGQPMQVYYMYKEGISLANSTLALLVNLCSFQIITISFALFSLTIHYQYLTSGLIWFFICGITLNASALMLLLIAIFSNRLSNELIGFVIKVLKFFKAKNIEQKKEKLEGIVAKYQGSAVYIKTNKRIIVRTLFTTFIQIIIYYSIPYWVYCSFGLSEKNIFEIITMQAVLYATVSGIPSPGAVGVSEGGFMSIFKTVFPQTIISSAMLLNRGVSFYLFVIITAIVSIINALKTKKTEKS